MPTNIGLICILECHAETEIGDWYKDYPDKPIIQKEFLEPMSIPLLQGPQASFPLCLDYQAIAREKDKDSDTDLCHLAYLINQIMVS
jgi:hypothetical protein